MSSAIIAIVVLLAALIVTVFVSTIVIVNTITSTAEAMVESRKDLPMILTSYVHDLFDKEGRKLAEAYAEERRLIQWIEELAEKGELDIAGLVSDAEKRAYALAVKKAEDSVTLAEASLAECRRTIHEEQKGLFTAMSRRYGDNTITGHKATLKGLNTQEDILKERLKTARAELSALTGKPSATDGTKITTIGDTDTK